jgi:cation-transporting ATPase 13A2
MLFFRRAVYGHNEINVPLRSIMSLLFLEVLNPFYVFQVFSFCLWFADDYVYYAVAILIMSSGGIAMSIIQTRTVSNRRSIPNVSN